MKLSKIKHNSLVIGLMIMLFSAATAYLYSTDETYLQSSDYMELKASLLNLFDY